MDDDGKVVGEARQYDPYSQFGHIMLYEIDSFGFVPGFVKKGLRLMSEEDLMSDRKLRESLETAKYECWKRHNIRDLLRNYEKNRRFNEFESFCRQLYEKINSDK